ncbi:MAG: alpha/beta hydrolase [Bacteroidetes bacterium]|nr:alpha/beta hydrolase [Bacteroidota bacterium]
MIRLILAILLFLLSLLVLFKAPTNLLWRATVAITEFPYVFVFVTFLFLISCFWADYYKFLSVTLGLIALLLFSSTIFRAYFYASKITIENEFPAKGTAAQQLEKPFSFTKMFSGIGAGNATYKTIAYTKSSDAKQLSFDYYPANTNQVAPCVIVIHGGSWAEGDSQQLPALNSYLANHGCNVASVNYRMAPDFKCPAPIEDTKEVMNYIIANAAELKVDTANFILLGRSAGGQIALLAAYTFHDPRIKGVISFYAPADMVWGAQVKGNKWVIDTDKVLSDYIGGLYKDAPEKYKLSSPFEFVESNSTPTLIIHGKHDCMVGFQHSVHLKKKLDNYHVKNYFLDLPWATHGCDYNINGPSGQITTYTIERFINSATSTKY